MSDDRVLADTVIEAMRLWDAQKKAGASKAQLVESMEQTLRAAWPKSRDAEWKYLCQRCNDYGLEMLECPGDNTCGRDKRHAPHEFGKPCWCSYGARFRQKPKTETDHADGAGARAKRPTKLFGR